MNATIRTTIFAALLLGMPTLSHASIDRAQRLRIHDAVQRLVSRQTEGLPGKVRFTLGEIDPRLNLAPCSALHAFLPPGARLWGQSTVGVHCAGSRPWTVYIPVSVSIFAKVVVAARQLVQGRPIEPGDIYLRQADLGQLPIAVITDPREAIGRIATLSIAPGQPLRRDLLRSPPVVRQGQMVTLRALGAGFVVSSEGRAVNTAGEGQVAQVRTASGRTVSGIAHAGGIVEIR